MLVPSTPAGQDPMKASYNSQFFQILAFALTKALFVIPRLSDLVLRVRARAKSMSACLECLEIS